MRSDQKISIGQRYPAEAVVRNSDAPVDRKPLIECELTDLDVSIAELHATVSTISARLGPVILERVDRQPAPEQPNIDLPPLGERLRQYRRGINAATDQLRGLLHSIEV